MNLSDVHQIMVNAHTAARALERHSTSAWTMTADWESPLRSSAGGPQGKGGHGDPVAAAALAAILGDRPASMGYHVALVHVLERINQSNLALLALLAQVRPADPTLIRGRVTSDPGCVACGGPAPSGHRRSGKCDACRKAWERAGRPDLTTFRAARAREEAAATQPIHEHEVTA